MADRIELHLGHAPWRPTKDSELVATYRYYDGPLTGIINQHGNDYVFSCLDGEAETLSLWYYAPVRQDQRERLESLPAERFPSAFREEPWEGCMVLAFATERLGIVDFEPVEDDGDASIMGQRVEVALRALRDRLSELSEDARHLELTPA